MPEADAIEPVISPAARMPGPAPASSGQVIGARWIATTLTALLASGAIVASVFSGGRLPSTNERVVADRVEPRTANPTESSVSVPSKAAPSSQVGAGETTLVNTARSVSTASPAPSRLININTASAAELELLPDIGPALASRIVEHRLKHGPFRTPSDLDKVRGIGEKTLEKLKPLISFEIAAGTPTDGR